MKITFWGVRGSIPAPLTTEQIKEKLIFLLQNKPDHNFTSNKNLQDFIKNLSSKDFGFIGGNTSCVEINIKEETLILDMGSGMKPLGLDIKNNRKFNSKVFHIFLSHTHWDHISGLPFFNPAHNADCHLNFYSPLEDLKIRLEYQQDHRFFPVGFELLKAKTTFYRLIKQKQKIGNTEISHLLLNHPGKSYAYKIKNKNKIIVYMTDVFFEKPDNELLSFCKNADLLIFDAQFTSKEIGEMKNYGHSTGENGVDLAILANIKQIALFHHDPDKTEMQIHQNFLEVKKYKTNKYPNSNLEILLSYEGLVLKV